jgi:hypothetical protein
MSLTEMEKDIAAAMDNDQLDDAPDDIESDIMAAAGEKDETPAPEPDEKPEDDTPPDDKPEDDEPATEEAPKDDDVKTEKPPAGWTPQNREHWAGLPDGLKQQISKREKEINTALQSSSEERKLANSFTQTAAPYQSVMAAEGARTPLEAFKGLLDTASTLKMGSSSQKAQKISDMIKHYGVDIGELDTILSGQQPVASPNAEFEKMLADRLKPMEDVINGYKQRDQQSNQAKNTAIQSDVEKFGETHEFFSDVRMMMADAMDMAAKQGRNMTMDDAYSFAVNMSPEIKSVIDTRASQTDLSKKKLAAASLNHRIDSGGERAQPDGLEAQITAAWDGG